MTRPREFDFGKRGFGPAPSTCKGQLHRCHYCNAIVLPDRACDECGSRKTRVAWKVTDKEFYEAVEMGYDPDPAAWQYMTDADAQVAKREGLRPGINEDA